MFFLPFAAAHELRGGREGGEGGREPAERRLLQPEAALGAASLSDEETEARDLSLTRPPPSTSFPRAQTESSTTSLVQHRRQLLFPNQIMTQGLGWQGVGLDGGGGRETNVDPPCAMGYRRQGGRTWARRGPRPETPVKRRPRRSFLLPRLSV